MKHLMLCMVLLLSSTLCFASNVSTQFIIINNSNYVLKKISSQSNGMKWDFPAIIDSKKTIQTHLEFIESLFSSGIRGDSGSVAYEGECPNGKEVIKIETIVDYRTGFKITTFGENCINILPSKGDIELEKNSNTIVTLN